MSPYSPGLPDAPPAGRILVVARDADTFAGVRRALEDRYSLERVVEPREAVEAIGGEPPDLVLIAPDGDGLGLLREVRSGGRWRETPVVILVSEDDEGGRIQAFEAGADDWLVLPLPPRELRARLGSRVERRRRCREEAPERAGRAPLHAVLNQSHDGVVLIDAEGTVLEWSEGEERITGIPRAEAVSRPLWELHHRLMPEGQRSAAQLERARDDVLAALRDGVELARTVEREIQRPDGSRRILESKLFAVRSEGRLLAGAITRDVTERRLVEEERRAGQALLLEAEELANLGSFARDLRTGKGVWSDGVYRMLGLARGAVAPERGVLLAAIVPEDRARIARALEATERDGIARRDEFRVRSPQGLRTVLASVELLRDGSGAPEQVVGTVQDVTERRRAESAVRESEERFRALVAASSEVLYRMSPDWREMRGLRSGGFLAETESPSRSWWEEYIPADEQPRVASAIRDAIARRGVFELEHRVRRADGGVGWTFSRAVPITDAQGEIVEWFGAATDVTERRRMEQELRESEKRFRVMADSSPVIMWVTDREGGNEFINRTYCEFFGVSSEQALGHRWHPLIHPDDTAGYTGVFGEAVRERRPFEGLARVRLADGEWRWLTSKAEPRFSTGGEFLGHVGASLDITDRKLAAEELRRSEATLNAFFEASPGILNLVDDQLRYLKTDSTTPAYFGLTRESIVGRSVAELAPEFADQFGAMLREVVASGVPKQDQVTSGLVPGRVGEVVVWRASYFPVPLSGGRRGLGVMGVEITDLKKAEAARERLVAALQDEAARRSEFLAVLSHELRNPLAPIRNSLYVLDRAPPGGEQARRARAVVGRQVEQLARLVDDLLEVTRLTRSKVQLRRVRLDLRALVERTVEDHRSMFEKARVQLRAEQGSEPAHVNGDPQRLAQVVGNLLQNAAKFTPPGGRVTVAVDVDAAGKRAALRVADTGEGMAPELVTGLFQPFTQAKQGLDRSKGGLGLGLALVKGLVELQGGEVEARSAGLGRGSEFFVRLPLADEEGRERPAPSVAAGARRRVLVIEDNVDSADSLSALLGLDGHEVAVAYDGPSGLAKARELHPDLVLCDLGLPGMDGYAVARTLRADEELRGTRLVALSGYALPEDVARAADAGFERHLAKPPSPEMLERVLAEAGPTHAAPGDV